MAPNSVKKTGPGEVWHTMEVHYSYCWRVTTELYLSYVLKPHIKSWWRDAVPGIILGQNLFRICAFLTGCWKRRFLPLAHQQTDPYLISAVPARLEKVGWFQQLEYTSTYLYLLREVWSYFHGLQAVALESVVKTIKDNKKTSCCRQEEQRSYQFTTYVNFT